MKALRKLHGEYDSLQEEYKRERAALEAKFNQKRQVIFDHRKKIVAGEHEPTPEPDDETNGAVSEENIKGVPDFWLSVISEHPEVGGLIAEEDIPALNALTDITVAYDEAFKTFTLSFHFKDNEHFTNAVLTKTYTVEPSLHDEFPTLQDVQVSPIDWKVGKNLTMAEVQKKQKAKSGRNKGQVRTVTRTVPKPSFFNFFKVPGKGEEGEEEEEEEEQDQQFGARIKFNIDEDYDIAHIFRTSIVPEAVLYVLREKDFSHLYGFEVSTSIYCFRWIRVVKSYLAFYRWTMMRRMTMRKETTTKKKRRRKVVLERRSKARARLLKWQRSLRSASRTKY